MLSNAEKLEGFIDQTTDPVVRGTLFVLQDVLREQRANLAALEALTKSIEKISHSMNVIHDTLDQHTRDEDVLLAKISGGQRVGAFMLSALIALSGYIIFNQFSKNEAQVSQIASLQLDVKEIRSYQVQVIERVRGLEARERNRIHEGNK